ncbi:ankyrin repeat-containing domain protein [Aspergillus karnatakaensis]|uniref:ankyrin repeat domain-containing protein n=1 Tax=Aspergillus karnatakaensis TaxID=1810916 RepID=UPI003CCD9563
MLRDGNANVQVSQYGITENDTKPDIWAVSRQVVDSKLQRKPEDVRTHLAEKAAEKAEGMFLWVHLLSQKLKPGINAKKLDAVVSQMPTGLEQAYERDLGLIHSLDEEEKQRAISILRWVLFAARPLTVRELVEALILNDDMDEGDSYPEDELPDDWKINFVDEDYVNEVLRQPLGSLIQLKNRDENEPLSAYTVHFVHYSVKEYLLRPNASGVSPAQEICFSDKRSENNLLARLCLQYLCYDVFGNEEVSARGVMKMYPFFRYAAHTWYRHALADNSISPDLVSCARKLLDPETFNWVLWSRTFENGEAEEQKGAESLVSSAILTAKSPMYYACLLGLLDVVKRLQTDGLDINVQGGLFGTPLQAAIVKHHSPTVQYLIDNGVDINVKAGIYSYAICGAAWTGDLEIFQLLLDRGADLEATQERNKWRPVHFSAYHPEVLKICVDRGVELEAQDSEGRTPLHWAAIHGKVECAQLLVDAGVNINAQATTSVTALLMAVQNNHYDTFVFLLSRGANPNLTDSLRQTPLYKAAVHGREKMVQALLENGAKVDSEQCDSYTPLMAASTYPGYPRIVELLLQHGADIDHRDKDGWTALHFASTLKNTETMRILLEHGAEVDPESTSLVTPLLQTGTDGSRDAFELLLQYGADISKYDIQNDTILDYALEAEKHDFVEYLLEKDVLLCSLPGLNADSTRQREQRIELSKAIFAGNADAVERILQAVLSDDLGTLLQSALHVASIAGTVELIKILLGKGASNRTVTATQRTALHYAASQGHHEFVKALLDSDANPYAQDLCRSLPLDVAIKHGLDAVETVKYLVHNYGFGPNHTPATPALINACRLLFKPSGVCFLLTACREKRRRGVEGYMYLHMLEKGRRRRNVIRGCAVGGRSHWQ